MLEIGCGSGLLTKHLVDAGHRVVATDASPAMLDLARETAAGRRRPPADAAGRSRCRRRTRSSVSAMPSTTCLTSMRSSAALAAIGSALRPGGVLAIDLCDLEWARERADARPVGWLGDDWALITEFSIPSPDRFVRQMATFVREVDGSWRRGDERHDNVLLETERVPALLAEVGVEAAVRPSFGEEELPAGLRAVVGRR